MLIHEIQADIEEIEKNSVLYDEINFTSRAEAIDDIEFNVIDRIEGLIQTPHPPEEFLTLKRYAKRVQRRLQAVDDALFQQFRSDIRTGGCRGTALRSLIDGYVRRGGNNSQQSDASGYDSLDTFINGLLLVHELPSETKAREPEMVFYQQTPARIIFELVERACLTPDDVLYDVGSGLGHVPILVHLLSGATTRGIEYEPAYCEYARACAADLNLPHVAFINADARAANYSDGTVFFLYTPCRGRMLHNVLERLREESQTRTIRLFTYGPCTPEVSQQRWLESVDGGGEYIYRLSVFRSC